MAEIERDQSSIPIQQFGGLVLSVGRTALDPGQFVRQENMMCDEGGVIRTRPGLKPVEFDDD